MPAVRGNGVYSVPQSRVMSLVPYSETAKQRGVAREE
jgi:hypothetical protein